MGVGAFFAGDVAQLCVCFHSDSDGLDVLHIGCGFSYLAERDYPENALEDSGCLLRVIGPQVNSAVVVGCPALRVAGYEVLVDVVDEPFLESVPDWLALERYLAVPDEELRHRLEYWPIHQKVCYNWQIIYDN